MREILRNLLRRKVRSTLTISGIVIGIFALTTMGALAEHFNSLLDTGVKFAGTGIPVGAPDGQQSALLPLTRAAEIARVPGVAAVYPRYSLLAEPGGSDIQLGAPDMIGNEQRGADAYGMPAMSLASGRDLAPGERGEVVLGAAMASKYGKHAGDTIDLPVRPAGARSDFVNHPFTVVGLLSRTGNPTDQIAFVDDTDARMLLADSLPPTVRKAIDTSTITQGFNV